MVIEGYEIAGQKKGTYVQNQWDETDIDFVCTSFRIRRFPRFANTEPEGSKEAIALRYIVTGSRSGFWFNRYSATAFRSV